MSAVQTFDSSTFTEAIASSDKPVLVDFWAEWCGPCKTIAPVLAEVAAEHSDKITIAKVNVDENPDLARQFSVMGIPTFIVFKDGQPVQQFKGAMGKANFVQKLAEYL